jgi:uncharacterized protein (DUF1330 family)
MVTINHTALADFLSVKDDSAIVMLNLLRFAPDGGRERHFDYLTMAAPILARFGAKILFRGDGLPILTDGEVKMWDAVLLVQYPGRAAFMAMVEDPEYQVAFQVGKSALADIVLQPLKQTEFPA